MSLTALLFPGQGSQFPGMGKNLYEKFPDIQSYFDTAKKIIGFNIKDIMFEGSPDDLKSTKVTQPAIFLHSIIVFDKLIKLPYKAVAGHSLGEFSALVASHTIRFEDGLNLVYQRAMAMQDACDFQQSAMAAVLMLDAEKVMAVCDDIKNQHGEIVVPANYNSPSQIVISGSIKGIQLAETKMKEAGARRVLKLNVNGAFHSPFMQLAYTELEEAIKNTHFKEPRVPIYQNVNAKPITNPDTLKLNLLNQIIAPVLWTQTIQNMFLDGISHFVEVGPGKVLEGLGHKIEPLGNYHHTTDLTEILINF